MGSVMLRRVRVLGLLAAGLVLGMFGMTVLGNTATRLPHLSNGVIKMPAQGTGHLALACVPKETTDDTFFISCGGIY